MVDFLVDYISLHKKQMGILRTNITLSKTRKDGRASIVIRASYNGRTDLYSGYCVKPSQWNTNKQRVKQGMHVDGIDYNIINDKLNEMEQFCTTYINSALARKETPSVEELKRQFNYKFKQGKEDKSDEFYYLFDKFIEETSSTKGWGTDMLNVFNRLKRKWQAYKPKMTFDMLSTEVMDGFKTELSKTMYNDAIDKNLSYFRQFINWARNKNYRIHPDFLSYKPKLPKAKKAVRYLTLEDLDTLYHLDLSSNDAMDRVRDIFIFQCYTALRYSDVAQLKRENIKTNTNGDYIIDILTEKDDDRISFRLPMRAVTIYKKYENNLYEDDLAFPIISNQKYNAHLKTLGEMANLKGEWIDYEYRLTEKIAIHIPKQDLTTHTARRTFVVTAMNEGVDLELISAITSHSDVKAMKPYIKANRRGTDLVIDALDKAVMNVSKIGN